MLPVSLNCPFLIAPSVFSYVNFHIFNELTDELAILSRFLETMTHSPTPTETPYGRCGILFIFHFIE